MNWNRQIFKKFYYQFQKLYSVLAISHFLWSQACVFEAVFPIVIFVETTSAIPCRYYANPLGIATPGDATQIGLFPFVSMLPSGAEVS